MLDGLAEADPRVQPDLLPPDAGGDGRFRPRGEEGGHLGDHVLVMGRRLHGAGFALHVHQHHAAAQAGGGLQAVGGAGQRGHVVPDVRAGGHRGPGHGGLHGVHRDRCGALPPDGLDHRRHARELDGLGHRLGARTGGLSADVEHVRAGRDQPSRLRDGGRLVEEAAAVREGIGGDVDHPHDQGAVGHAGSGPGSAWVRGTATEGSPCRRSSASSRLGGTPLSALRISSPDKVSYSSSDLARV